MPSQYQEDQTDESKSKKWTVLNDQHKHLHHRQPIRNKKYLLRIIFSAFAISNVYWNRLLPCLCCVLYFRFEQFNLWKITWLCFWYQNGLKSTSKFSLLTHYESSVMRHNLCLLGLLDFRVNSTMKALRQFESTYSLKTMRESLFERENVKSYAKNRLIYWAIWGGLRNTF